MKEKIKEFERALDGESINLESGEDAEFIIRKTYLSKTDPCYCGSGKKVIDCCIPDEKFNEITIQELRKQSIDYELVFVEGYYETKSFEYLNGIENNISEGRGMFSLLNMTSTKTKERSYDKLRDDLTEKQQESLEEIYGDELESNEINRS
jgi:hypothetical protein